MQSSALETGTKPLRSSHQMRALLRKTISYQKRQTFVNVCCILLCPIMMVAISGIMGVLVLDLVMDSMDATDTLYCSSLPNATETSGREVPGADPNGIVLHLNVPSVTISFGGPMKPSTAGSERYSCVNWFEHNYPAREPYEPASGLNSSLRFDSTYLPDPEGGWLNLSNNNITARLLQVQTFPWAYVRDASGVNSGRKERMESFNLTEASTRFGNASAMGEGLLGAIDTDVYINITNITDIISRNGMPIQFQPVPFFEKVSDSTVEDVDDLLANKIVDVVDRMTRVGRRGGGKGFTLTNEEITEFTRILTDLPWGAILFDAVDNLARRWKYTLQIGSDDRIQRSALFPTHGFRLFVQQAKLGTAIARTVSGNNAVSITHGIRMFPELKQVDLDLPVGTLIGRILFPFGISFLLPIFVIILVREKEDRIFVMMSMNGMKARNYYLTHFLHFLVLQLASSTVFVITGICFDMELFTKTDPGVYIILLLIWSLTQITLAFFLSCFFSKSRTALIAVFLLVLAGVMISTVVEQFVTSTMPLVYFIWPPFAFYRALSIINTASISKADPPYRMSDLTPSDEVSHTIIALVLGILVYLLLTSYLHVIMPREYGVKRPWYFPVTDLVKWLKKISNRQSSSETKEHATYAEYNPADTMEEDEDVKAERERVLNDRHPAESPLILKRMRKAYSSGKLAVKDVTFAVESDIVFGLLGPNGAGKTTLISILTGLYEPTSGDAWLNGFNIKTEMEQVYMTMGICPQHDILWNDLTVEEHLLFYARLKGVPIEDEEKAVQQAIAEVALQNFRTRLSKGLSGGEKRRLSIAIALIGNPGVVFLDEPTTGLDPEVKRVIWNIINQAKQGRTLILTTHSMEEAEVLCNRIGIMAKGALRCIGLIPHLKDVYGKGFRVSLNAKADKLPAARSFLESLLPEGWIQIDDFATCASYEFKPAANTLSTLFEQLEKNKAALGIDDWGISQTSLEEVFLRIVSEADADADPE